MAASLESLSPVDGRYSQVISSLAEIFSEKGLMRYRLTVEGEYLISLSEHPIIPLRKFSEEEKVQIRNTYALSLEDALLIKEIEIKGYKDIRSTNHDLKAVEYFLKDKMRGTTLQDSQEWVHFGLTSEDTNNIAYGLMLSDGMGQSIIPTLEKIQLALEQQAQRYRNLPMLARTHGQAASPTTLGKELKVFSSRLEQQLESLGQRTICAKLNGATGNYNALAVALPEVDWLDFSSKFIERLNQDGRKIKLKPNLITTQIEPGDSYAELFDGIKRVNNVLMGLNQDLWRYISDGWLVQETKEGEIGSSTMPHKVNPINFENSEGNLGLANALLGYFSAKLPISRLQRDLSDSTVKRNFGVALGHCLIGYQALLTGLGKVQADEQRIRVELEAHPEVLAEAVQTILRREGLEKPYEQLLALTRGKKVSLENIREFCEGLELPELVKSKLMGLVPGDYTGLAGKLVDL